MKTNYNQNYNTMSIHEDKRLNQQDSGITTADNTFVLRCGGCCEMSKSAAVLLTQLLLAVLLVSYCMFTLAHNPSSEDRVFYAGILTFVVGLIFPSPLASNQLH